MVRRVMAALAACVLLVGCAGEPERKPRLRPAVSITSPGWTRVGMFDYSVERRVNRFLYRVIKPVGGDAAVISVWYGSLGNPARRERDRVFDAYEAAINGGKATDMRDIEVLDEVLIGGKPSFGISYYYVPVERWVHEWYVDCMDTFQCMVYVMSPSGAESMDPSLSYAMTGLTWDAVDIDAEGYTWPDSYTPPAETSSPTSSR